jgi:NAD(P)-dependent dehydrogenase (short-subunit alcohol dehydrogenase family)
MPDGGERPDHLGGRRAVITGSGAGVGRAIASHLARAGAEVWINDVALDRAEAAVESIRGEGGTAHAVVADVTDAESVAAMARETGPVDIVVNNAGTGVRAWADVRMVPFVETTPDDWDPLIRVNLLGVLHVTRQYLQPMLDQGWGRVLMIVSDAGRKGDRKQAVYGAAKAGAMGFARGLAAEVGRNGVTVNCISLGTMVHASFGEAVAADPDLETQMAKAYPLGRLGRVDDPAPLAVLLCSDAGAWITGQVYPVDGGYFPAL